MRSVSGKQLCSALEKRGWLLKRVRGSHHVYVKPGRKERLSIPVHGNTPLKTGLLCALLKVAGLTADDLD